MCFECQRRWRENHEEAMKAATAHMNAQGIAEDSLIRGVAEIHLACNANPILAEMMKRCWPGLENLMQ